MDAALHFDAESHTYTIDGQELDSVTTILKPLTAQLYRSVGAEVMERAAALGTAVHKLIELDIAGTLDEDALNEALHPYLVAWRQFRAQSGFEPLLSEQAVHSPRYRYAGMLDLFGLLNGDAWLIDAKRCAVVPRTAGPQTAGYEAALRESQPHLVAAAASGPNGGRIKRAALHLIPGEKYRLVPFTDPNDARVFLSALTLHNWSKAA